MLGDIIRFMLIDVKNCIDGKHDCEHKCIELEGGYRCECNDGYRLQNDSKSCEGMHIGV